MNDPAAPSRERIGQVVMRIATWLDTMRCEGGYGGPVAHWWQDCLRFTGAGLDWRYEGIILGYLTLHEKSGHSVWLDKACRAGDDLIHGQLPNGCYRASSFEVNPYPGGTPHEAACDYALIGLAAVLRQHDQAGWETYSQAAEHNLKSYLLARLWDPQRRCFQNLVNDDSFVPNKAATTIEALLAWAEFSGELGLIDEYVLPTLHAIMACQVHAPKTELDGAIDQSCRAGQPSGRYFPFYIARCIPGLVEGYRVTGLESCLEAAHSAAAFILGQRFHDGSFPQVVYGGKRANRAPRWIAGAGDILRALTIEELGLETSLGSTLGWLLAGQLTTGGVQTAQGFSDRGPARRRESAAEFRDILPACGWVDKAFRYLAGLAMAEDLTASPGHGRMEAPCLFRGTEAVYHEDEERIEVRCGQDVLYRWRKGTDWAEVGPA